MKVKSVDKDLQEVFGMEVIGIEELPAFGTQKSFYGKAKIISVASKNSAPALFLLSYSTVVAYMTAEVDHDAIIWRFYKLWNEYSMTTMNHVNAFRYMAGLGKLSKKEWLGLPCYHYDYGQHAVIGE